MILINGQAEDRINVMDRGVQYGDGVFETIAYREGVAEFFTAHLQRLLLGCRRLKIDFPEAQLALLTSEFHQLCAAQHDDVVIKIIITRGQGGRGYRYASDMQATRIISAHPMPHYSVQLQQGINVRLCQHTLPHNPILAGIKHLNRLDQILARNEWQDDFISEGLMRDQQEKFIEGTMSNLFIVKHNQLYTPSLENAGIAGIMRLTVMQLAAQLNVKVSETTLTASMLQQADELFLCNSLAGIWPVTFLIDWQQHWSKGPITERLQHALQRLNKS